MKNSIAGRLEATGGYSSGFDYLRIVLSTSVLLVHSFPIVYGAAARWTAFHPTVLMFIQVLLPMFFALSGFLVSASLLRVSIPRFLGLRVLRIFPALVVEVVLSALILGPLLTEISLGEYFSNHWFYAYFYNIIGHIHYSLPGVFTSIPYPNVVNGSLWTVPFELECYLLLTVLALLRVVKIWQLTLVALVIATAGYAFYNQSHGIAGAVDGRMLVMYFLAGVTIYGMRHILPFNLILFVVSAVVSLYSVSAGDWVYISPIFVAYATAYIGLLSIPKAPIIFTGDYSYGMYLYAFPVQQTVMYLSPPSMHTWYYNASISLVIVSLFAAFSWHFIEKPTVGLKKYLKQGNLGKRDAEFVKEKATEAAT